MLNGDVVTKEGLRTRLAAMTANGQTVGMYLEADPKADFGAVSSVLEIVQQFPGVIAGVVGST